MYNICKKYVPYINTIRYNIKHDIYKKKQKKQYHQNCYRNYPLVSLVLGCFGGHGIPLALALSLRDRWEPGVNRCIIEMTASTVFVSAQLKQKNIQIKYSPKKNRSEPSNVQMIQMYVKKPMEQNTFVMLGSLIFTPWFSWSGVPQEVIDILTIPGAITKIYNVPCLTRFQRSYSANPWGFLFWCYDVDGFFLFLMGCKI